MNTDNLNTDFDRMDANPEAFGAGGEGMGTHGSEQQKRQGAKPGRGLSKFFLRAFLSLLLIRVHLARRTARRFLG